MSDTPNPAEALKAIADRVNNKASKTKPSPATTLKAKLIHAAPYVATGPIAERGYSVQKAVAFAKGIIGPDQAKEEIEAHHRLKAIYGGADWGFGARAMLVPTSTAHIPVSYGSDTLEVDGDKVKYVNTLRQKMAAGVANADPDEAAFIRKKAGLIRKDIGTLTDTGIGAMVGFPTLGEIIEIQRNNEIFSQAGATEYPLPPNGRISFPKQTNTTTAYMVGESNALTESDPTVGMLDLEAKKMTLWTRLNGELFKFASPAAETLVRTDFAEVGARKVNQQFLEGVGGTEVLGLLLYPTTTAWSQGTDKVILHTATTTGTNGDTFQFEDPSLMQGKLPDAVGNEATCAWVMRRLMFAYLRNRRADAVTAADGKGPPLFNITGRVEDVRGGSRVALDDYPVIWSNLVSNTRVKGSGTNLTYILLGYFKDWITARYGVMEILTNPWGDTAFQHDQVEIRGIQRFDGGARHPASFVLCDDLLVA